MAKAVKDKARKERLRLNQAIVRLLEEATGEKRSRKVAHHDLDHLAGKWSEEQYQQFMDALREQRQSRKAATACGDAGLGLRNSSPSSISATLFSGAFSTSSYVARFIALGSAGLGSVESMPPFEAPATLPGFAKPHLR